LRATKSRERRRVKQRARVSCAIARRAAGRRCDRCAEFNDVAETCMRQGFLARRRTIAKHRAHALCGLSSRLASRLRNASGLLKKTSRKTGVDGAREAGIGFTRPNRCE